MCEEHGREVVSRSSYFLLRDDSFGGDLSCAAQRFSIEEDDLPVVADLLSLVSR
jgi:hypothetical protein